MEPTRYFFKTDFGASEPLALLRIVFDEAGLHEERWEGDGWVSAAPSLLNRVLDGDATLQEVDEAEAGKWFPEADLGLVPAGAEPAAEPPPFD